MREIESLRAENIGLKDIAQSRSGELISRVKLIMYLRSHIITYYPRFGFGLLCSSRSVTER